MQVVNEKSLVWLGFFSSVEKVMQLIFVLRYVQITGTVFFVAFIYFSIFRAMHFQNLLIITSFAFSIKYPRIWEVLNCGQFFDEIQDFFPSKHRHSFINPKIAIEVTYFGKIADVVMS